jgi:hypothetical protein
MHNYLKVYNNSSLVRDKKSKAILSVDADALVKYRNERERMLKLNSIHDENLKLKQELSEIKSMLVNLLGR